jgi:hypothetical protein
MLDQFKHATTDEKTTSQTARDEHPASGRYGWYVETDKPTTEDGIVIGDYISVSSQGALYVWGSDRKVSYAFEPGTWKFVFPQLELLDKVTTSDDLRLGRRCIFLGNLEDLRTMSKQPFLICEECVERSLVGEQDQQHKH